MKRSILTALLFISSLTIYSQNIEGSWHGVLKAHNLELRIVFNIEKRDTSYFATMDSPDQGAIGIPVQTVSFQNTVLKIAIPKASIEYSGLHIGERIIGTFHQSGQSIPTNLSKKASDGPKRPQNPVKPYSYYSEDVKFRNAKGSITL